MVIIAAPRLQSARAQYLLLIGLVSLQHMGSSFSEQGLNLYPLHHKADS